MTYSQIFEQKRDCSQSNPNFNIIESGNLENIIELCITEKTKRQIKTEKSQPEIACMWQYSIHLITDVVNLNEYVMNNIIQALTVLSMLYRLFQVSLHSIAVLSRALLSDKAIKTCTKYMQRSEKNKNCLPSFVAFSTVTPFNSFQRHPVDNLFGFSFLSQSEIKCWQALTRLKSWWYNAKRDLGVWWTNTGFSSILLISWVGDYTAF